MTKVHSGPARIANIEHTRGFVSVVFNPCKYSRSSVKVFKIIIFISCLYEVY